MKRTLLSGLAASALAVAVIAHLPGTAATTVVAAAKGNCSAVPTASQLKEHLNAAPAMTGPIGGEVGGLFSGSRMWAAVVNRDGEVCAYATSTDDPTQVWPGSQAIAKAKAYTANAFSLDALALSTARLYTFTQPGHSLWSLGQSNLFNANLLVAPGGTGDKNQIAGGTIFFGGGVPIYEGGKIVGGLGISGDTSCADHEIAKRVRQLAGMSPGGDPKADDIVYATTQATASVFAHPVCLNTYLNGVKIGDEAPAFYPKAN
jgi:uncharacterized protein GlcG (DUF336 family)